MKTWCESKQWSRVCVILSLSGVEDPQPQSRQFLHKTLHHHWCDGLKSTLNWCRLWAESAFLLGNLQNWMKVTNYFEVEENSQGYPRENIVTFDQFVLIRCPGDFTSKHFHFSIGVEIGKNGSEALLGFLATEIWDARHSYPDFESPFSLSLRVSRVAGNTPVQHQLIKITGQHFGTD